MRVLYSPQVSSETIEYIFDGEKVSASYNGITETYDFSNLQENEVYESNSALGINPITSAKRIDDEIHLELLNFIGMNAVIEDKFPKEFTV